MNHHDDKHDSHHGHHLVPFKVYYLTLAALIVLTVVTVGASYIDFGKMNIVVSLSIATAKAALVMLFFMGLKYDTNINRIYIMSSFFALFLLIFFVAADLWTKKQDAPVKVKAAAVNLTEAEFLALQQSTPDLVNKGKDIYNTNCASCHGLEGKGNGVAAETLNPRPRNFHAPNGEWKNGSSSKAIYVTLAYGIPGSGMGAYKALSPQDRWALVHYVHTMTADVAASSPGDAKFAQAVKDDGIGAGGAVKKTPLPVDFAIERVLQN